MFFFLMGLAAIQVIPALVPHASEGENLYLDESFLVPMTLMLALPEILMVFGVAVFLAHAWKRMPWYKMGFNVGQVMLSATFGFMVASVVGGLLGAVLGGVVYAALSALAVNGIVSYVQGTRFLDGLRDTLPFRTVMLASSVLLGAAMNVAIVSRPEIFPPVAMGVIGLQMWYKVQVERLPALAMERT